MPPTIPSKPPIAVPGVPPLGVVSIHVNLLHVHVHFLSCLASLSVTNSVTLHVATVKPWKLWTCISQCSLGITFFLFYFKIWWVVILKLLFIYLFSIFSPQVYHFFPLQQLRQDEHHTNMKINRIIITRWVEPCFLHFCSITLHMTLCSFYQPLLSGPAFV